MVLNDGLGMYRLHDGTKRRFGFSGTSSFADTLFVRFEILLFVSVMSIISEFIYNLMSMNPLIIEGHNTFLTEGMAMKPKKRPKRPTPSKLVTFFR